MNQASSFLKKPFIPFILWGILFILSLVYAAERGSYTDSAWQFFEKLNSEQFIFPQFRYGVFWMAIPSWLLIKLGLPLVWQLYFFSFSYIFCYFIVWSLCYFPLKNQKAAWLVLLSLLLGTRQNFVHTSSETLQALAYSALFYALIQAEIKPILKWTSAILVLTNTMLVHPIAVFVLGFVVLVDLLNFKLEKLKFQFVLLGILVIWSLSRFLFSTGNYDAGQYALLKEMSLSELLPWKWISLKFLITRSYYLYWPTGIMTLWCLIQFWKNRTIKKGLILFSAVLGYTLIAVLTFRKGDSDYMMEKNFLPSVFMVSLIFLEILYAEKKEPNETGSRLLLIACVGGLFICWRGILLFSDRLAKIDTMIESSLKANQSKSVVIATQLDSSGVFANWALGVETYMRSLSKFNKSCTIYAVPSVKEIPDTKDFVAVPWENIPNEKLNPKFFPSDTTHYHFLQVE